MQIGYARIAQVAADAREMGMLGGPSIGARAERGGEVAVLYRHLPAAAGNRSAFDVLITTHEKLSS